MRTRTPTTKTATAIATATDPLDGSTSRIPIGFHAAAAAWLVGMLVFSWLSRAAYEGSLQEDRFVEWWTAALFAAAALLRLRAALRARRAFDLLVGLFCIFVAGEEFSWGQRLLGYTPPNYFLAHNTQQEFTLHNFADIFGQPKNVLILALAGFGVFLPLARHWKPLRTVVERVGATLPSVSLMPWFAAAIVLLVWYPVDFTGEWVETLAGGLFLVSSPLSRPRTLLRALAVTAATGVALAFTSSLVVNANPAMLSCAHAEARALISDIEAGFVTYDGLLHNRVHKRIRSAVSDAYMAADLRRFRSAHCEGEQRAGAVERRRFAIDPWGLPYWVRSEPDELGTTITVYSFGPNRRRDNEPGQRVGDDVMRAGRVPAR